MPEDDRGLLITPSIWDRLFDNRPVPPWEHSDRERENRLQAKRFQNLQDLKRCVARDLELMLNTKRELLVDVSDDIKEIKRSIVCYGLPDFTSYTISNRQDRRRVELSIKQAIESHEQRLRDVRVIVDDPGKALDRVLRFRVEATLQVNPANEKVSFNAVLQLNTQRYEVKGGE